MRRESAIKRMVASLVGRGPISEETGPAYRVGSALLFVVLVLLVAIFWPSAGVFVYEGF